MSAAPNHSSSATLSVDNTHPSLPGHFPGLPVVPGVVLLSQVLTDLARQLPRVRVTGIKKLKFLRMLFPDRRFTVEFGEPAERNLRFKCWQDGDLLAEGNLALQVSEEVMPARGQRAGQPE
jgi:3-hydroxyacyl-[acyl-carrier-protein] dehydratase